jgi:hypothetical protein
MIRQENCGDKEGRGALVLVGKWNRSLMSNRDLVREKLALVTV